MGRYWTRVVSMGAMSSRRVSLAITMRTVARRSRSRSSSENHCDRQIKAFLRERLGLPTWVRNGRDLLR